MFSVEQRGSSAVILQSMQHESPWNYSKKIQWQHGSIREYTDKWKMFVSQIQHWTKVK